MTQEDYCKFIKLTWKAPNQKGKSSWFKQEFSGKNHESLHEVAYFPAIHFTLYLVILYPLWGSVHGHVIFPQLMPAANKKVRRKHACCTAYTVRKLNWWRYYFTKTPCDEIFDYFSQQYLTKLSVKKALQVTYCEIRQNFSNSV